MRVSDPTMSHKLHGFVTISLDEHRSTDRTRRELQAGRRVVVKDADGRIAIRAGSAPGRRPVFQYAERK